MLYITKPIANYVSIKRLQNVGVFLFLIYQKNCNQTKEILNAETHSSH